MAEEIFIEDTIEIKKDIGSVQITDDMYDTEMDETVEYIEISQIDDIAIDIDSSFPTLGEPNVELRHSLLNSRDEPNQHPITAITGLREELDDIKALDVVFSNEKNQADYYLWDDENLAQENRIGLFVTLCDDTDKIRACTEADDIFGVTIPIAAFIGGQDNVVRDYKYGLVVYGGIAAVRCELSVETGDYIIPNNYGYAKKSDTGYGYRVFALEDIKGVPYAIISLDIPANIIHTMSHDIEDLGERMDDAEINIAAAINRANAAYNKAGEVGELSEEAIKQVLEALKKAEDTLEDVEQMEENVSSANQLAAQARAIAESAATSAVSIRDEAVATANEALSNVNDLIKDLEPINEWEYIDPNTGEKFTGASYFVQHVENDLVTRTEIESAGGLTTDALSAISQNAKNIEMLVSSIDKYSVGEYSQAYGLSREQAKSILKPGYIYIPTKNFDKCCDAHADIETHCETFLDDEEVNYFTPGDYYVWGINDQGNADWIEHSVGSVWISSEPPANSNGTYKYWYLDSNEPAEGYEAYALYIWEKEQWVKVNILDGNVNNRLTSMIRQTADKIAIDVVNAQDGVASHQQWLDNNSANIQAVVSWKSEVESDVSNIATIKQTADAAGASVSQVAAQICSEYTVVERWNAAYASHTDTVYYTSHNKMYHYYANGIWNKTPYPTEAGLKVDAASIVTAINKSGDSSVAINADKIVMDGETTFLNNYFTKETETDANGNQTSATVINGGMIATSSITASQIATGSITANKIKAGEITGDKIAGSAITADKIASNAITADKIKAGSITADKLAAGAITANELEIYDTSSNLLLSAKGNEVTIGAWKVSNDCLKCSDDKTYFVYFSGNASYTAKDTSPIGQAAGLTSGSSIPNLVMRVGSNSTNAVFGIGADGAMYATKAYIAGKVSATSGTIGGWTIEETKLSTDSTWNGYSTEFSPEKLNFAQDGSYVNISSSWVAAGRDSLITGAYWVDICSATYAASTLDTGSDERIKSNIESFSQQYEVLFDNLAPKRYKYIDGTSDRYHTGFIAQEVVDAVNKAGLTTQDFAAVMLKEPDTKNECWHLRRDEFVALNTWQIQKLKARVTELEERLLQIEQK